MKKSSINWAFKMESLSRSNSMEALRVKGKQKRKATEDAKLLIRGSCKEIETVCMNSTLPEVVN